MNVDVLELHFLCERALTYQSPILSGNMVKHIKIGEVKENSAKLVLDAKFYDLKEWRKSGRIIFTGKIVNGQSGYARIVNESGAFAKHNYSEHWVNRALLSAVENYKNLHPEQDIEIICEVKL